MPVVNPLCTPTLWQLNTIRTEKTPHTSLDLKNPTDCALFIQRIFVAFSRPLKMSSHSSFTLDLLLTWPCSLENKFPCGLHKRPAVMLDNSWRVPSISTPHIQTKNLWFQAMPGHWVVWMYSLDLSHVSGESLQTYLIHAFPARYRMHWPPVLTPPGVWSVRNAWRWLTPTAARSVQGHLTHKKRLSPLEPPCRGTSVIKKPPTPPRSTVGP
jgi:hypothetical protein